MKLWLDDKRWAPKDWIHAQTVDTCIQVLKTRQVSHVSFDNDLGEGEQEGYIALNWLEEIVHDDPSFPLPEITVHSANAGRVPSMRQTAAKLEKIRQQQIGGQ